MESYKNRELKPGQLVKVYFNITKKKFSVISLENENKGKVVCHADSLRLLDCDFTVSEKGRERVLKEKVKNVHAFVIGTFCDQKTREGEQAFYNPFLYKTFVLENGKPLHRHQEVSLNNKKIFLN